MSQRLVTVTVKLKDSTLHFLRQRYGPHGATELARLAVLEMAAEQAKKEVGEAEARRQIEASGLA